jgi:hypothetical protein
MTANNPASLIGVDRRLPALGGWLVNAIGARSIREFDERFPMTQSLFN